MNVFDMAVDLELNGEQFYRSLAEDTKSSGLKSVFNMLADDENKHKMIFKNLGENVFTDIKDTAIISKSNTVFTTMKKEDFINEKDQINVYKKALELEQKSIEYYKELLGLAEDLKAATAVERIIFEEEKHRRLLQYLIEYISRPDSWVEDAEFYLKENY